MLLRNGPWPTGKRSTEIREAFLAARGVIREVSERDLKVFAALRTLRADPPVGFQEWLVTRRPASGTALLSEVLGHAPDRTPVVGRRFRSVLPR